VLKQKCYQTDSTTSLDKAPFSLSLVKSLARQIKLFSGAAQAPGGRRKIPAPFRSWISFLFSPSHWRVLGCALQSNVGHATD